MLYGRFGNSSGRPYLSARVFIPRFGASGNVSFIFDTGADNTVLMPADAAALGIDFTDLSDPFESLGIGGSALMYPERAHIAFLDESHGRIYAYDIELLVHHPTTEAMRVPSLLGRDIIDRWRVTYDKSVPELSAEVNSSDAEFPI